MNINHEENIIYRLSELTENDLPNVDLTFHLFRIQKESDDPQEKENRHEKRQSLRFRGGYHH